MRAVMTAPITGPQAWLGRDMAASTEWIRQVSPPAIAELDAALRTVQRRGLARPRFGRDDFPLPTSAKARANARKHGVSFEDAATVFADPRALDGPDLRHSLMELRSLRIGRSNDDRSLVVPEASDEQLRVMRRVGRPPMGKSAKQLIAIRLDPDVLARVRHEAKQRGMGYQSLINAVLARYAKRLA